MLIKKIPEASSGVIDMLTLDQTVTETALQSNKAANADRYSHQEMQMRRLRRQNRQARGSQRIGGWSVSSW